MSALPPAGGTPSNITEPAPATAPQIETAAALRPVGLVPLGVLTAASTIYGDVVADPEPWTHYFQSGTAWGLAVQGGLVMITGAYRWLKRRGKFRGSIRLAGEFDFGENPPTGNP
ncbi:hypothetical protein [Streptomyces sp. Agncl-13]|uniref:hypothetical protein n=1 Tax=Streptomyces sp. Agncl-13 TaxID=3400628 RepID=UPI003A8507F1